VLSAPSVGSGALRGHFEVEEVITPRAGRPAESGHALIQLSSGSTGPSKVIGRTAAELIAEVDRYTRIDGMPRRGDRLVLLNSLVHAFGLIGGLLHALHARVAVTLPSRMTADGILAAVSAGPEPTTVFGVPFHAQLLSAVAEPPCLPSLAAMVIGGELVRPNVPDAFAARFGVPLGQCYGMTEMGVITMDVHGRHPETVGLPAPGITVRVEDGQLVVHRPTTPYVGAADPTRWVGGWLRTRDAATIDPASGAVTILGRLDSQVAVGGLKVDLTEVEHTLAALPGVIDAVVVYDGAIDAYLAVEESLTAEDVEAALATRLALFKRPRRLNLVPRLPRTPSGKQVRDPAALRASVDRAAAK
jgi:3-hydroxy-4-methylanthranilate adenylyltransferase